MPRSLSTITPEAIRRSNETTKKLISRLLVDVDLKIPPKDSKIDAKEKLARERNLKRITPKIRPIVSHYFCNQFKSI